MIDSVLLAIIALSLVPLAAYISARVMWSLARKFAGFPVAR